MIKFIKRNYRQFPKKNKNKKTMIMPRNYNLFVGVALNIWNLRVLQGVTETEHQALQEGVGGGRKREAKMSLP